MSLRLRVYDIANQTHLGDLDKAYNRTGVRQMGHLGSGRGEFTVNLGDDSLLARERVVRWQRQVGGAWVDWQATIIESDPTVLRVPEGQGVPSVRVQGPSLLGWLDRAIVYPQPGLQSRDTMRRFGPLGEIDVTGVPEPTTGGKVTRTDFSDRRAFRFVFSQRAVYHRVLGPQPDRAGEAVMELTSASWTDARVYLDGREVFHSPVGSTETYRRGMPYDGLRHIVAIEGEGNPPGGADNSIVWSWYTTREVETVHADPDGDYTTTATVRTGLFRTFNSATFDGPVAPQEPFWAAWEDYDTYPGVTVGYIVITLLEEFRDRAEGQTAFVHGLTYGFDEDVDSAGNPWPKTVAHGFNTKSTVLWVVRQLRRWGCDAEITPDGRLDLWIERGNDLTGSVAIGDGDLTGYQLTGPPIDGNVLLAETEGGFGESFDASSISQHGRIETGMESANSTSSMALEPAVESVVAEAAWPQRQHVADLSFAGARLLDDADLGDRIVGLGRDGPVPVRTVQQQLREDESGAVSVTLTGVPA